MLTLTEQQIADADLRLAYVQHPFPAQGQTTDTTHLIISEHATREGSYVGLTRARARTDIYAATAPDPEPEHDRLQDLAEHMSRTEPDLPSIRTPSHTKPRSRRSRATRPRMEEGPHARRPAPTRPLNERNQPRIATTLHTETNGLSATGDYALEIHDPDRSGV